MVEKSSETNEIQEKKNPSYDRFYSQFSSVLGHFFWPLVHKKLKDAQCSDRSFCIPEFFCAILSL